MVSARVYAAEGGDGGGGTRGGDGDHGGHGSSDSDNGDGSQGSSESGNHVDGSIRTGSSHPDSRGGDGNPNGSRNETRITVPEARDQNQKSSNFALMTVGVFVIQHAVSMRAAQASAAVVLVASTEAVSSVGVAWWSQMESNAARLCRKFFFLTASVGERIRRENVLDNRKRREIYRFVVDNPFSHFRKITRMAGVGPNEGS